MALTHPILAGNARLEQAAAGGPSVKPAPPHDEPDAVRRIQRALFALGHPLPISFAGGTDQEPDGKFGQETLGAVLAFQRKAFPGQANEWDGRVGKKTLAKMDAALPATAKKDRFNGFTDEQVETLKDDLARAQRFLNTVILKISGGAVLPSAVIADTDRKVRNIFKTEDDSPGPITIAFRKTELMVNYRTLKRGIDEEFPLQAEASTGLGRSAFVIGVDDPTVHVHQDYFDLHQDDRAATLIHERAHTVLRIPGHPGTGDVLFCVIPDEGVRVPPITYDHAIRNAYCYELLALALQPDYSPTRFRNSASCACTTGNC